MDILISGAGIAGSTLAYWLARNGMRPTVVERASGQRSSGNPVDVRDEAVPVAERMGLMPRLREASTGVTGMRFVNARGRRVGGVNMRAMQRASGKTEVEVPRADLARILLEASKDDAEYVYGDSIATLTQDGGGVDVTFDKGAPRRFDLVIGADGLHSVTRKLTFGPEADFIHHLGLYVATLPIPGELGLGKEVHMYNTPGRLTSLHPSRGGALAAFIFRSRAEPGFDHRDLEQHKRMVTSAYAGDGWRVPELLDHVRAADDLYFDAVSQVRLAQWHSGRVGLLGDAASSVSLFGDGSSMAMAGALTLAEELAAGLDGAFARYEGRHRVLVDPKHAGVAQASTMVVPATRIGVAVRNLVSNAWPVVAAGSWLRGRLTPSVV